MQAPVTFGFRSQPTFMSHKAIFGTGGTLTTFFCSLWINAHSLWKLNTFGWSYFARLVLFDHARSHILKVLEYFYRLRDHQHFCMLMHMPSTRATLELVQSSSTDFCAPAALLLKAPRANLDFSCQVGWHLWDHFEPISKTGTKSKPTFGSSTFL